MKNMILNENDEVNVISGSITASTVFKLHPKEHGIALEYDGRSDLFISIQWSVSVY